MAQPINSPSEPPDVQTLDALLELYAEGELDIGAGLLVTLIGGGIGRPFTETLRHEKTTGISRQLAMPLAHRDPDRLGRLWLGRTANNDLFFPDASISRLHASIRPLADGTLAITDVGSSNGTFLDDQDLRSAPGQTGVVPPNRSFRLGSLTVTYLDLPAVRRLLRFKGLPVPGAVPIDKTTSEHAKAN